MCCMISSAVLQDIFGTDRSSQDIFILVRNTCNAEERCDIRGISSINICNLERYLLDYRYECFCQKETRL